jgi:hypothetical protein
MSDHDQPGAAYGLRRPTLNDLRNAVHRVHGAMGPAVWADLLIACRLTGDETDAGALPRVLAATVSADPITQLCAHALRIRLAAHMHLSAAHAITRS